VQWTIGAALAALVAAACGGKSAQELHGPGEGASANRGGSDAGSDGAGGTGGAQGGSAAGGSATGASSGTANGQGGHLATGGGVSQAGASHGGSSGATASGGFGGPSPTAGISGLANAGRSSFGGAAGSLTLVGGRGGASAGAAGGGQCAHRCPTAPPLDFSACDPCADAVTTCTWYECADNGTRSEARCDAGRWIADTFTCPDPNAVCCDTDATCRDGEHCVGQTCQPFGPGECWLAEDCGEGETCAGGQVCGCGSGCGRTATPGVCIPDLPECCSIFTNCGGDTCIEGICKPWSNGECWNAGQCDIGYVCEGASLCRCGSDCLVPDQVGRCVRP
jgi:hypothetical protein